MQVGWSKKQSFDYVYVMRWSSSGWYIGSKKWSGGSQIASIVAKDHGLWRGLLRGAPPMIGSYVNVSWAAKDVSNLGNFKIEVVDAGIGVRVLQQPELAGILMGLCEAVLYWCGERDAAVYDVFSAHIKSIDKRCLLQMLQDVLQSLWGCSVECDFRSIASAAYKLQLRRLPLCYALLSARRN